MNKARSNNMPNDTMDRAIKKGTGDLGDVVYEEIRYEGYGPAGVAIMVDTLTDNKNRTAPEVRSAFTKNGGNLGETGCVGYMFDRKGIIAIAPEQTNEDDIMELLIDFDIEDIKTEDDGVIEVTTTPEAFNEVSEALQVKEYTLAMNEVTMIPQTTVALEEDKAEKTMRLIDILEELDDVQNVYSNADISDEIMEKISG